MADIQERSNRRFWSGSDGFREPYVAGRWVKNGDNLHRALCEGREFYLGQAVFHNIVGGQGNAPHARNNRDEQLFYQGGYECEILDAVDVVRAQKAGGK